MAFLQVFYTVTMHKKIRNKLILLIITLSLLTASYEVLLTWQRYPTATIDTGKLTNHNQYIEQTLLRSQNHQNDVKNHEEVLHLRNMQSQEQSNRRLVRNSLDPKISVRHKRSLKQLIDDDPDLKEQIPVKIVFDCHTLDSGESDRTVDRVCVNETKLWYDLSRRGVDIDHMSDRQRKAALLRVVLAQLERPDEPQSMVTMVVPVHTREAEREKEKKPQREKERERQKESKKKKERERVPLSIPVERRKGRERVPLPVPVGRVISEQREKGREREPLSVPVQGEIDSVEREKEREREGVNSLKLVRDSNVVSVGALEWEKVQPVGNRFHDHNTILQTPIPETPPRPVRTLNDDASVEKERVNSLEELREESKIAEISREHRVVANDDRLGSRVSHPARVTEHAPKVDIGRSQISTEHAPKVDNGRSQISTEHAPKVDNGRSQVSTEHAPKGIDTNGQHHLPPNGDHDQNHPSHDGYNPSHESDYHDSNNYHYGGVDMPNWVPPGFIDLDDNSNQRAPVQPNPNHYLEISDLNPPITQSDPLDSILAPLRGPSLKRYPNKRGSILARKKKDQKPKKWGADYYNGLNFDKAHEPLQENDPLNFDLQKESQINQALDSIMHMARNSKEKRRHKASNSTKNQTAALKKVSGGLIQMSEELFKLVGYRLPMNLDSERRNFPTNFSLEAVHDRLKYIDDAIASVDEMQRGVAVMSLDPNLLNRTKFQQSQMSRFCSQNHIDSTLPQTADELDTLFQHLLYDDKRRLVYCYIPKNGCSNMKRMMLVLNEILPPESIEGRRPAESVLKEVHSFRNLTRTEALHKLQNYYKVIIVRNPMERLLSAYRNKLEHPLNYTTRKQFPDRLKAYILRKYDERVLKAWLEYGNYSIDIHPSFSSFLQFMVQFPLNYYNEHFQPMLNLCSPCAVQYHYYMNFKSLDYDVYALMHYLGIPFEYYPQYLSHPAQSTSDYLDEYFEGVALSEKVKLFRAFSQELEFYYSLYPEEWGMHKDL